MESEAGETGRSRKEVNGAGTERCGNGAVENGARRKRSGPLWRIRSEGILSSGVRSLLSLVFRDEKS